MQNLPLSGFHKSSLVDYPGKMAAVVFTPGCNMDCFYCHNRRILTGKVDRVNTGEVLETLRQRRHFLQGLVITGGEPTLHEGLEDFIRQVKEMGLAVKLDTNGTNPELLKGLIAQGLLDYVAMDIKAPGGRYAEIAGERFRLIDIERSVEVLLQEQVDYEFRTTVVPQLESKDIYAIGRWINGARRYCLQQYRQIPLEDRINDARCSVDPHPDETLLEWARQLQTMVAECRVRNLRSGAGVQFHQARPEKEQDRIHQIQRKRQTAPSAAQDKAAIVA